MRVAVVSHRGTRLGHCDEGSNPQLINRKDAEGAKVCSPIVPTSGQAQTRRSRRLCTLSLVQRHREARLPAVVGSDPLS